MQKSSCGGRRAASAAVCRLLQKTICPKSVPFGAGVTERCLHEPWTQITHPNATATATLRRRQWKRRPIWTRSSVYADKPATRLEVSQCHQTWHHVRYMVSCQCAIVTLSLIKRTVFRYSTSKKSWPWNPSQRSLKVIGTDTDRSATYDFLLTFHSNNGPILYHFRDKHFASQIFSHPYILRPRLKGFPLELGIGAGIKKLEWWGYRAEKEVWRHLQPSGYTQTWQTDGQTDNGGTDIGRQQKPRLRIVSRGKNVKKTFKNRWAQEQVKVLSMKAFRRVPGVYGGKDLYSIDGTLSGDDDDELTCGTKGV